VATVAWLAGWYSCSACSFTVQAVTLTTPDYRTPLGHMLKQRETPTIIGTAFIGERLYFPTVSRLNPGDAPAWLNAKSATTAYLGRLLRCV